MADYSEFAKREQDGWAASDLVSAYVEKFGPVTDTAGAQMLARFDLAGTTALDLCCGQGNLTRMLTDAGAAVTGLDFSPEMLRRARATVPQAALVEADAAQMPFEAESFDLVFNNFGMMHLPDPAAALAEVGRVLKPGGRFAMATWEAPVRSPAFGIVFGTIKALADFSVAPPQPDLFAFTEADHASDMLAAAGLRMTGHDTVEPVWTVSAASDFFDIFLTATVGAAMLIRSQTPKIVHSIRERITKQVADNHASGARFVIPVPVCIVTAQKD